MTTGRIFNRNEESIILSAPRANLFGEILTYSNSTVHSFQSLTLVSSLRGSYGGYIGYSLLAVDINGDGLEEILASEPLYSDLESRIVEIGRVVVIGVNNVTNELEVSVVVVVVIVYILVSREGTVEICSPYPKFVL